MNRFLSDVGIEPEIRGPELKSSAMNFEKKNDDKFETQNNFMLTMECVYKSLH